MGIPDEGLVELAKLSLDTGSPTAFGYLAVGSSDTAFANADSALGSEITDSGLARAAGTASTQTTNVTDDTAQLTYTWTVSATKSIKEVGATNVATVDGTGEKWLGRTVLETQRDVSDGDTYTLTHKTVFARS